MKRLLFSMLAVSLAVPGFGTAAFALPPKHRGVKAPIAEGTYSSSRSKRRAKYIDINALHQSLSGSHLYDEHCLLFRVSSCDVIVLADENDHVKYIFVRVDHEVKKSKRREILVALKERLRALYRHPQPPNELLSADGSAVLFYYDSTTQDEDLDGDCVLSRNRCDALNHMLSLSNKPKLREASGLGCGFRVELEKVEIDFAVDFSHPTVEYVELRGGRIFQSKMKVNVEEDVQNLFLSMEEEPSRQYAMFGKGSSRLRVLSTDSTYYLGRNARFFAAGTPELLKAATAKGACYKKYGFDSPDFSQWEVTLPAKVDVSELTKNPKDEEEPETETPKESESTQDAAGADEKPETVPVEPAQPVVADKPLTPEAALEAYLKMLREM